MVKIEGNKLIITLPLAKEPKLSTTGKTRIVATTHGRMYTGVDIKDMPLTIMVNATIPA